jgi:hypothetical protein
MEKIKITDQADSLYDYDSVEEYLNATYGEKKLKESRNSSVDKYTFLDVIGYTLDEHGYETENANTKGYYELDEIVGMMKGNKNR